MSKALTLILMLVAALPAWAGATSGSGKAIYYTIEDPFTINFLTQSQQKVRFLQIRVAIKSRDPGFIETARHNQPMIQDALRKLFADQQYEDIATVAGREQLQKHAREQLAALLEREAGRDGLEEIYFTSFILQ